MHQICGTAVVDTVTKRAIRRILPGQIAVLQHEDIDRLAARDLIEAGVRGIVNLSATVTGRYRAEGPLLLLKQGIPVLDVYRHHVQHPLEDGMKLWMRGNRWGWIASPATFVEISRGRRLTHQLYQQKMALAEARRVQMLSQFLDNTLAFMAKEKELLLTEAAWPQLKTRVEGRLVVIVVRGSQYREDLRALRHHLEKMRPLYLGVDGGADALLQQNILPDLILGDMDSVSDEGLHSGAELVVHAYPDGRCPGINRVLEHGLEAVVYPSIGTSEDAALLLMNALGAERLILIGSHFDPLDFWEKGRQGMGSTLLVRTILGERIIDAKGLNALVAPAESFPMSLKARREFSYEGLM